MWFLLFVPFGAVLSGIMAATLNAIGSTFHTRLIYCGGFNIILAIFFIIGPLFLLILDDRRKREKDRIYKRKVQEKLGQKEQSKKRW